MADSSIFIIRRLYYLDWLRVLAFAILIIANCAEVFGSDKWWIANPETNENIAHVLIFFRQWRMPLLFIISGVAVSVMLERKSITAFIEDRFWRILIPLISGMLLVVPPMIFYIWRAQGNTIAFQDFYLGLLDLKWFPDGNLHWLHLWYLAFVLIFSIGILPVVMYFKNEKGRLVIDKLAQTLSRPTVLFPLVLFFHLPFYAAQNYFTGDNVSSLLKYFPFFLFGCFFFTNKQVQNTFMNKRKSALFAGILTSITLYVFIWTTDGFSAIMTRLNIPDFIFQTCKLALLSLNQWFWVITFSGFALRYLNFGNNFLSYANRAIYPFYIFQQPVIIIIAYYLIPVDASIVLKFIMLLAATFLIILITYELLLKRFSFLKLMFGIRTEIHLKKLFPRAKKLIGQLAPYFVRSVRSS